ncbi:hypothetical protein [Bacillus sp. 1P06AnD]|uniref:hypothetical protein n=1 Tax=Bacillus sp. 1P06AnD TaxID=3132208 RepID=UPI00399FFE0C
MSGNKKMIIQGKTVHLSFVHDEDTHEWAYTAELPDQNVMGFCKDIDRERAQKISIHRLFMALEEAAIKESE